MTVTINVPNISAPLQVLTEWLTEPGTQRWLQESAAEAIASVERSVLEDKTLRSPRTPLEKSAGFNLWLRRYDEARLNDVLEKYRSGMASELQNRFDQRFPEINIEIQGRSFVRDTFLELAWPRLEAQFRERAHALLSAYAVRSIVLSFLGRNIGDGFLVGVPEQTFTGDWSVSIFSAATEQHIADVHVDINGEVVTDVGHLNQRIADSSL